LGPDVISQEDLWTVTLDGELVERFPAQLIVEECR
jgi:hypothetical protein